MAAGVTVCAGKDGTGMLHAKYKKNGKSGCGMLNICRAYRENSASERAGGLSVRNIA